MFDEFGTMLREPDRPHTTDADGNAQDTDATPDVTVTVGGVTVANVTANEGVGVYSTTFTPTGRGRHVVTLDGVLDTFDEFAAQFVTVHDGAAEAAGGPFPDGKQSWVSAVS